MEANNLNILKIINYMGSYISQEDFIDIEQSLSRRKNVIKNIFFIGIFIIALQLVSYALMNVGR
jgi:hypothetical protein